MRMNIKLRWVMAVAIACALAPRGARAQERFSSVEDFLVRAVGLNASQLSAVGRGEVVDKLLPTGDARDVAVFGATRVGVPRAFFVERQRDYSRALRTPTRLQAHVFSSPATVADVQLVDFSDDDVKDLANCQPNDCNFKLPATAMEQLRQTISLSGPDARSRVAAYARQRMVDYVRDYRQRGNAAMAIYDDLGSVHASEALAAMLRDSSLLFRVTPAFARYLNNPLDTLAGLTNVIFWSLDRLPHVRQVLRITDESVYSPPELPGVTILAEKQIYANHYFEAGLQLLTVVDQARAGGESGTNDGVTLLAFRRYRFDHLPSGGLLNIRGRVIGGLRDNLRTDLTRLKSESEAAWRAQASR
jgi:hypothetical protein